MHLLIGDNVHATLLEYLAVICIIGESIVLKLMGHWEESTEEIECMRMALVRNLINTRHPKEERP